MIAKISVRRRFRLCLMLVAICSAAFLSPQPLRSQQDSGSKRKLIDRTPTPYPTLARSMALEGLVKLEALVAPDGTVKSVDIKGGHPVLAQAAVSSVRKWRWEAAARESRELVEVRYSPE
jgi:TonB family protein